MANDTPKVVFIDDSATMREVIKIAFRRENIDVVAYTDGNTALDHIADSQPDVVITDVIMPNKDGYEVCQFIKQHPQFGKIPVILMSGVVNRAVAEKAFAVKADELIRKPFQPQDLITRVKHLLQPSSPAAEPQSAMNAAAALSSIFAQPTPVANGAVLRPRPGAVVSMPSPQVAAQPAAMSPMSAPAQIPTGGFPSPAAVPSGPAAVATMAPSGAPVSQPPRQPASGPAGAPVQAPQAGAAAPAAVSRVASSAGAMNNPMNVSLANTTDVQKLRVEAMRLEGLVKKLQSELFAEREYVKALEAHIKTLQDAE